MSVPTTKKTSDLSSPYSNLNPENNKKNMRFQAPRGMRDLEPVEFNKFRYVWQKIREVINRYGFQFVIPTVLEDFETISAKSGKEIESEIYVFKDKADRKIALRFDLTVGMARMVAGSSYPRPIKLACISNMWRYDRPQYARYREFWQWDIEIFGCSGVEADAEIIAVISDILDAFDLDYEIRISNRKLVEGILLDLGINKKDLLAVLRLIDKSSKIRESEFIRELEKYTKKTDEIVKLGRITNKKLPKVENELAKEGKKEIEQLFSSLKSFGKDGKCVIDLSVVRGIDYYTGLVYEAWIKGDEELGAVAGGGRYDDLVGLYGKDMPATGVAGGLERLLLSLKNIPVPQMPKVLVIYVNDDVFDKAVEIAQALRKKVSASIDLSKRGLSKQLEYANKLSVEKVVIVGPKELAKNKVKVRNMKSGKEEEIDVEKLDRYLL